MWTKISKSSLGFLFWLAILFQFSFFLFALTQKPFFFFFPHGNVHEYQGIDFFQVPNGAYAFLNGGELTGKTIAGESSYFFGNTNVYHPFFTFVVGGFLQFFSPMTAFLLWRIFNLLVKFSLIWLIYKKMVLAKTNKQNLMFALFLFLANFPQALEMWNGQYHFLLDAGIVIFFLFLKNDLLAALGLVLTFMVKPITILWLPVLVLQKKTKIAVLGVLMFIFLSLPFLLNGAGQYYLTNLIIRIGQPIGGPPGVFTLDSLLRFWELGIYLKYGIYLKIFSLLMIIFLQWKYKISLWKTAFLMTSFYLLFYDLVFEYHYTTVGTLLALGVIFDDLFKEKTAKVLAVLNILPTPFFLMYLFQIGTKGHYVTDGGWSVLVLSKILPLIFFNLYLIMEVCKNKKNIKEGNPL
ncbi:MAG: hypothetical protein COU63_01570 [Candidatus Pacebacteria bacterium CG10_big_fil_rev_8_21_14_0_10_36_11]|nr:DUF2029 domain-containing protein [Candidatus Pacearchaeota archaeon]OIP73723.1 MAG: hypothetical protein AUK08_04150 [Candidatus Pacebacteria bacterium CG2_30_36_39]PIR64691.1 MAG: hypothetical protein COU63_01570 [Candidatus Pacebacteria bacterium CG10_big_fil_rev_8_21_14_0_10_36_11]PJC43090.1 MAG: hypothetical protein CO040_01055 [Candidatus Pacebacteria bacterium CG_4_9_14_0_2_um_filter_36_8]